MKKSILILMLFFFSGYIFGQKKISEDTQTWSQIFLNTKISKKSTIVSDFGYRSRDQFINKSNIWFVRSGFQYQLSDKISITPGLTYFSSLRETSNTSYYVSEFRPYLFITQSWKSNIFNLRNRYRLENRNIQKGNIDGKTNQYNSYFRVGYQWQVQIPLKGKSIQSNTPYLVLADELMINFGKNVVNNYFDQNRISAGFGYMFSKKINSNIAYQYSYRQRDANTFENIHTIRLNLTFNIDFTPSETDTN